MSTLHESAIEIYQRVLMHILDRVRYAEVWTEPFSHTYCVDLFPDDVYAAMLTNLPPVGYYSSGPRDPNVSHHVRTFYNLTTIGVRRFPVGCRNLWRGVVAALVDPALKRCLYAKLAPDLIHRYGIEEGRVPDLAGHPPTLYRDIEGYEIPPHPDTLKKVVTMHIFLPADLSQIHLGTALYQRKSGPLSMRDLRNSFTIARQFEFRPNSGYAFVVNNSVSRQSWHGREVLGPDAGVRNTLLNTFYADSRLGYSGYLEGGAETPEPVLPSGSCSTPLASDRS